ncbi:MAG: rod-binding protein [Nitrospinae bacterium]|nr:rod-binding protein [Nitrospinota bacterium]
MKINATNQTSGINSQFLNADEKKLKKLTADFESVFLYYVLKTMRDTVPKSGFIDGKNGEEIYRSMIDQEVAKSMADKRESGISDMLFKQLKKAGVRD